MKYTKLDEAVEKNTRYILVADATSAGTPIFNKIGLKMVPPPSPKAPEMKPPIKANNKSFTIDEPLNLISLSMIPLLYLIFNAYSF